MFCEKSISLQNKNKHFFKTYKVCKDNMNLQQKVHNFIQKEQLLAENRSVIVGISGGTDSVAMLHILKSLGYSCIIAHCNFRLRMEESTRDMEFVRNLSHSYSIPFYSIEFETITYAKDNKISVEMAARDLRYNWFEEIMQMTGSQAIAVAHHADDSIETMLMNLIRGTGLNGLTGIRPKNKNVVRPLLCCTREELENYLVENDLEHVEDSSNSENIYIRNKFRNEIIPLFNEINPAARENLYCTMSNLNSNYGIYQQAIEEISNSIVEKNDISNEIRLDIEKLKLQKNTVTILFELLSPYGFNSSQAEQIYSSLYTDSGKVFHSKTHRLIKDRKYLIINANTHNKKESYFISQDQNDLIDPIQLTIKEIEYTPGFKLSKKADCIQIDASKVKFPLEIRHWHEGDLFFPFGMTQKKKLSDYFIDQKFSIFEKEECWLMVSGQEIIWIVGHRLDNRFRIKDETTKVLEFKLSNKL